MIMRSPIRKFVEYEQEARIECNTDFALCESV